MIKIKAIELFAIEPDKNGVSTVMLNKMNPALDQLLTQDFTEVILHYDVQNKLSKAVVEEANNILEFRNKLVKQFPQNKKENVEKVNKKVFELLNSEIEIKASPIQLSRLKGENCTGLNFAALDKFIEDDRNG